MEEKRSSRCSLNLLWVHSQQLAAGSFIWIMVSIMRDLIFDHALYTLGEVSWKPVELWEIARQCADSTEKVHLNFSPAAWERIARSAEFVGQLLDNGNRAIYGLNTGFGHFAEQIIEHHHLLQLQHNLIVSHSCGVGPLVPREIVFAMWLLRLNTISHGRSGINPKTLQGILRLLNAGILGLVPSRGSVGASGDLTAAAHAALPLLGEGQCSRPTDDRRGFEIVDAARALADEGLTPLILGPKEGLSLINGTQFTTVLATKAFCEASKLLHVANLAAAMSMEAMGGAGSILKENVLSTHHPHTQRVGTEIANWLTDSQYLHGARLEGRFMQAPYCLRCTPQVHGAVAAELDNIETTLCDEYEVISDNPLLFPETGEIYSCGNFHAIYPARSCDKLASALTTLGNISERRINMAMDDHLTGLPRFLVENGGLNSGMMITQVTAAALVSECKSLSFPASVDSIPTNCDREDHVSMGPIAGHKALSIVDHVRQILAIELLVSTQALDLRLKQVPIPPMIRKIHSLIRSHVAFLKQDRVLANDIAIIRGAPK